MSRPSLAQAAPRRRALLGLAALALASVVGCKADHGVPLYPATGQVLVDGQPAEGVEVRLRPASDPDNPDAPRPFATTGADGSFTLGTFDAADGAPAGRYAVTLMWPDWPGGKPGPGVPADRLGDAYANPSKPQLFLDVADRPNTFDPLRVSPAPRTKARARQRGPVPPTGPNPD